MTRHGVTHSASRPHDASSSIPHASSREVSTLVVMARDDAYDAYVGGAYVGGDYGRGDRDARTRDAHTHQSRAYDDLSARSRPKPTSTTPPRPTTAPDASSASYSLNIGIHDRSGDAPWLYHPPILERGSTPSAWASAHRDVVPPTLAAALTPDAWGRCLDAILDAQTRHPCYRCPWVELVACLCGCPLCVAANHCNPLCWMAYCPYGSVLERCVRRMNAEVLCERGVVARLHGDCIVFDVVESAPRRLR